MDWAAEAQITRGTIWATQGTYLNRSMLRVLAKLVSDNILPEALYIHQTFEEENAAENVDMGKAVARRIIELACKASNKENQCDSEESDGDVAEREEEKQSR